MTFRLQWLPEGQGIHTGKGNVGISPQVSSGITADETALGQLAGLQASEGSNLFALAEPALATATNQMETLAAGDPSSIMRATAPQAQQIAQASQGASANIMANAPAGGEKNLALEQVDVNRGAQIGNASSGAVQSAYQSLGNIAGQTIPQAIGGENAATGALGTGISGFGQLGSLQLQGQQLQMEQKGQELGAFGGLAGDASQLGTGAMQKGGDLALAGAFA